MAEEKKEKIAAEKHELDEKGDELARLAALQRIIDEAKKHNFVGQMIDNHVDFEFLSEYVHRDVKCSVKLSFYIEDLRYLDPVTGNEYGPFFKLHTVKSFGRPKIWRSTCYDFDTVIEQLKRWQGIMEGYAGEYIGLKDEIHYEADADYDPLY